jgi:hypothetical protein
VRNDLNRRTFKDEDLWHGAEMMQLLSEYAALAASVDADAGD